MFVAVETQAVAIPNAQGLGVGGAQEIAADAEHSFHAVILPRAWCGCRGSSPRWGRSLADPIAALRQWTEQHINEIERARAARE
ncbi:hypothetical protein GCM10010198_14790 [Nocardia seriolae]|nr:hypothetical protein NSERKGN1266_09660 [Nocardia seriolae]BEK99142.1 hypothetical protein NSER024013_70480 [Nocardia seriolae]GEM21821.1 hypothetical protein NS2_00600 [Nocardia seriolae NBRC 15557]